MKLRSILSSIVISFSTIGLFSAALRAETITSLTDDFEADTISAQWDVISSDFEVGTGTYTSDTTTNPGQLTISGNSTTNYWGGDTLQSVDTFSSSEETTVTVDRISLARTGTAGRSSLWIWQPGGQYLHFAHNVGENGWQYNPTNAGGGSNIGPFDGQDGDLGEKEMQLVYSPQGGFNAQVEIYLDGELGATHSFTNWDNSVDFHVRLSGMSRASGDTVVAVFDNFSAEVGLPPEVLRFDQDPIVAENATAGTAYSGTLDGSATDPEGDPLTYSKTDGPDWLTVESDGAFSGTPGIADAGLNKFTVEVTDGNEVDEATLNIRVIDPNPPSGLDALFGWWPLNEGSGDIAADISGNGRDAVIVRVETGGLGDGGAGWVEDPECGMVLSFNGDNATGTYAIMTNGTPGEYGELPLFTNDSDNTFTWSLWVNADDNAANNDIILGNRYRPGDAIADWSPREFIKFDSNNFEFDTNNVQGVDYADIVGEQLGSWVHHVIVKEGGNFTYYRDGVEAGTGTSAGPQNNRQPLFFGGQGNFAGAATAELWRGRLFDVRLFASALSAQDVTAVFNSKGVFLPGSKLKFDVESSGDDLVLTWDSQGGKLYNLRSETDPSSSLPEEWPIWDGNADIVATPNENTLTIPRPEDPTRFFVIEEFNAPPVAIFSDDFESGQGDWTTGSDGTDGTNWELGSPSVTGPPAANSPANCFGTNLAADYAEGANVWLRSPAIDLSGAGGATLNFAQFRDIEEGFDFGTIAVLDAADDSELGVIQAVVDGAVIDWEQVSKSIPDEALGKTVKIEFRFQSDDIQAFAGWYIDDVEVTVP